jgi:hypothetical protein
MHKIKKAVAASEAIVKITKSNPSLGERLDEESPDMTIDQATETFDTKYPQVSAVIRQYRLSTREYFVVGRAFSRALDVHDMKRRGELKEYPADLITPENAKFVEKNYDALIALDKKLGECNKTWAAPN